MFSVDLPPRGPKSCLLRGADARGSASRAFRLGAVRSAFTLDTNVGGADSPTSMRIDANNAFHTLLQFALPPAERTANEMFGRIFSRRAAPPAELRNGTVWFDDVALANGRIGCE